MISLSETPYFYDPDQITQIVAPYPYLHCSIEKYRREDSFSTSLSKNFPYARKSYREIYRVLGGDSEHLQELLPALETCLANDFEPIGLFKPAASDFSSTLSVVFAARWFLERGYAVSGCDTERGPGRIFDFIARNSDNNFLIEVYSPRSWEGFHDFDDELRLALGHLDCPYDFSYGVNINLAQPDFERGILHFDPWDFSEVMETPERRFAIIRQIREDMLDKLGAAASPFAFDTAVTGNRTTTRINIKVKDISRDLGRLPARLGVGFFSLTGYAPERMFDHVLQRKVVGKKLHRRQLPYKKPKDGVRVLLIDVSRLTFLTDEQQNPCYRKFFLDTIERHLLERIGPEQRVDLITFVKMNLDPQFVFCCARGADGESEIASFLGDGQKLEVLRRISEFVIAGQGV